MSQATRSKVRARARHREQLARLLAPFAYAGGVAQGCVIRGGTVETIRGDAIARGRMTFDVHAARELGVRMVAQADEQAAFEHWCSERRMGPENREPFAHIAACDMAGCRPDDALAPSPLPDRCTCGSSLIGGWPGKQAREWPEKASAAMGRSTARMGQRLLDALAGQPSECVRCTGNSAGHGRLWVSARDGNGTRDCPDCRGTGRNLAGVLPGLEWSPAVRRKVSDSVHAAQGAGLFGAELSADDPRWNGWTWQVGAPFGIHITEDTRTVPRGEHRLPLTGLVAVRLMAALLRAGRELPSVDLRINGRGDDFADLVGSRLPRWRRGELRHAEQRRQRYAVRTLEHAEQLRAPAATGGL